MLIYTQTDNNILYGTKLFDYINNNLNSVILYNLNMGAGEDLNAKTIKFLISNYIKDNFGNKNLDIKKSKFYFRKKNIEPFEFNPTNPLSTLYSEDLIDFSSNIHRFTLKEDALMVTAAAKLVDKKGIKVKFIFIGFYPFNAYANSNVHTGVPAELINYNFILEKIK